MIRLDVAEYCQNCPDFEVYVEEVNHAELFNPDTFEYIQKKDFKVECLHKYKCSAMLSYLEKRGKKQ